MQNGSVYGFKNEHDKKIIYYHELSKVLSKERPNDPFWGTAIITNEKVKMINNHLYRNNVYIGSKYFGYESLMCYDFELDNGNIVTILNFYKKADASKTIYINGQYTPLGNEYDYYESFFADISNIVKNIENKNIVVFAGDFNADFTTREKIEKLGLEEKTKHLGNTMVEVPNVHEYHNDCIFINKKYEKFVDEGKIIKVPVNMSSQEIYDRFSDHYGIKCIIEL